MKVPGATRALLARAYTLEHPILGLAATVLALAAGGVAGWAEAVSLAAGLAAPVLHSE